MEYNTIASRETLDKVVESLKGMNVEGIIVKNKEEALAKIKDLIPTGATVMNGASKTLEEVGFVGHLKSGDHDWHNLHEAILNEKDPEEQKKLRHLALNSDFYIGSVHAIAETGEMVIVSNTGSQLPHIVYTSPNVIFVIGANKVMPTLEDARKRVVEHVVPLEDVRLMGVYNAHTHLSKELIFHWENPMMGRNVRVILVEESLGF
jgi:L-lactate utilization protein LutB